MNEWFHSPAGWYVLGFAGQVLFGSRFLVQWLASERARRVVIPRAFWLLSLFGGVALLFYAVHKRDPVFAVGQVMGLAIYARNLVLQRRESAA
ncbi:MAG: hypothetical protein HOP12_14995 [Candidatus Eisenbacteria bacterium]|uniref:Lipid A biosynthesis N-terminal domain-containing protein n=1 Tax=Eiseniibacteriota bacterium TaxID=2212470 RepID=A0A849SVR0_UNCEI|nr:hypothetical protein [Candidatus Eisenbacteria bacterium]